MENFEKQIRLMSDHVVGGHEAKVRTYRSLAVSDYDAAGYRQHQNGSQRRWSAERLRDGDADRVHGSGLPRYVCDLGHDQSRPSDTQPSAVRDLVTGSGTIRPMSGSGPSNLININMYLMYLSPTGHITNGTFSTSEPDPDGGTPVLGTGTFTGTLRARRR